MAQEHTLSKTPLKINKYEARLMKSYTIQEFKSDTVFTDDPFKYVEYYLNKHKVKALKFNDARNQRRFGAKTRFNSIFYWNQAKIFYDAAKTMPIEAKPLAAYYCMLNAAKTYLICVNKSADDIVADFAGHGLAEGKHSSVFNLESIFVRHTAPGLFGFFARTLDDDFESVWPTSTAAGDANLSLKALLYNLPFVHRAFCMTYPKMKNELFIPMQDNIVPKFYKMYRGGFFLKVELDKDFYEFANEKKRDDKLNSIHSDFNLLKDYTLLSGYAAMGTTQSFSGDLKDYASYIRKKFCYISGKNTLWYLKRNDITRNVINLSTMTINMAAMHRFSEIVRYQPENLQKLLQSDESWLIQEYLNLALDQFIDEIAAEITKCNVVGVGTHNEV